MQSKSDLVVSTVSSIFFFVSTVFSLDVVHCLSSGWCCPLNLFLLMLSTDSSLISVHYLSVSIAFSFDIVHCLSSCWCCPLNLLLLVSPVFSVTCPLYVSTNLSLVGIVHYLFSLDSLPIYIHCLLSSGRIKCYILCSFPYLLYPNWLLYCL